MTKSLNNTTFMHKRNAPENDYIPRIQPPWLKFDRKVLRFYAYFQEHVVESRLENYRIRPVLIYYYLSD
jgi:EF-hand domain-containing protein 1